MTDDQVSESEQTETSSKEETTQETQDTKQSDETKGKRKETESKLYQTPDGRDLTADQVFEEYGKLIPEFTRRSQRLKELEKTEEEAKSRVEKKAHEAVAESDMLKNMDPEVRAAIVKVVEPVIQKAVGGLKEESTQREKDKAFQAELSSLEGKYPGGDGKPKFERSKVLAKMRESDNRDFNPETIYEKLYRKELFDHEVKQALKKQKGGSQLETTGGEGAGKPKSKTPKTFAEAAKAAKSRI